MVFVRGYSNEVHDLIPDDLDFVYIDGNHDYEYVKKDIEVYYQKIRFGGVIGGHDFCAEHLGVSQAVWEFVNKHNLNLFANSKKDWWVVKP